MIKKTKCSVCDNENILSDEINVIKFVMPNTEGAKLYFDLWHFPIEKCSSCGYASKDISLCENSNIKYAKNKFNQSIINNLNDARTNSVEAYLNASIYYNLIGNEKLEVLCLLQAGDMVFGEILYWKEHILTEDEKGEDLYEFAKEIYDKGQNLLIDYIEKNPEDIDMQLLFVGMLSDDKENKPYCRVYLNNLRKKQLNDNQKKIFEFLENDINL